MGMEWGKLDPEIPQPLSPSARADHAMAYDGGRERIVLFDGNGLADTWEFNGLNWMQQAPATSPAARGGHAMAYDSASQRVILFGGLGADGRLNDTWAYEVAQATPTSTPTATATSLPLRTFLPMILHLPPPTLTPARTNTLANTPSNTRTATGTPTPTVTPTSTPVQIPGAVHFSAISFMGSGQSQPDEYVELRSDDTSAIQMRNSTSAIWDDAGDCAFLRDSHETPIDTRCYP